MGYQVKVRYIFGDSLNNYETRTSDAYPADYYVTDACDPTDTNEYWCAVLTAGSATSGDGFLAAATETDADTGSLSAGAFTVGTTEYTVKTLQINSSGTLTLKLDPNGSTAFSNSVTHGLQVGHRVFTFDDSTYTANSTFTWANTNLAWPTGDTIPVKLRQVGVQHFTLNDIEIFGQPRVSQRLYTDTSVLRDRNGVPKHLQYQWTRKKSGTTTNISGATSSSYQLTTDDLGAQLQLRLRYVDGDGHEEGLASGFYPEAGTVTDADYRVKVQNVTFSSPGPDNIYSNGETLDITVALDNPTTVDRTSAIFGTRNDATSEGVFCQSGSSRGAIAAYHRGSGTDTIVFRCIIDDDPTTKVLVEANSIIIRGTGDDQFQTRHGAYEFTTSLHDAVRPTITDINVQTPIGGDRWNPGETIKIDAHFSEPITVNAAVNTPELRALEIANGDFTNHAVFTFNGETTADSMTFEQTIPWASYARDAFELLADTIRLNRAMIVSAISGALADVSNLAYNDASALVPPCGSPYKNQLWCGQLTPAEQSSQTGYHENSFGNLSADEFSRDGSDYNVATVRYSSANGLEWAVSQDNTLLDPEHLSLQIGSEEYALSDAVRTSTGFQWIAADHNPNWVVGQRSTVRLIDSTPPPAEAAPAGPVLVSNAQETVDNSDLLAINDLAQAFTTGSHAPGYTLASVELGLDTQVGNDIAIPIVKITHGTSPQSATTTTLTGPTSLDANAARIYTFTAPANTTLAPSTTYWILAEVAPVAGNDVAWENTLSADEDTAETDWSIADTRRYRYADADTAYNTSIGSPLRLRVNGTLLNAARRGDLPPDAPAQGTPTISGRAIVGQTLTAAVDTITDTDGLGTPVYAHQWQRGGADIATATGSTYLLVAADADHRISVVSSFNDAIGNAETRTSDATSLVLRQSRKLVGALNASDIRAGATGGSPRHSTGFRTPTAAGNTYLVNRARILFGGNPNTNQAIPQDQHTVRIMTANNNYHPSRLVAIFDNTSATGSNATIAYHAPPGTVVSSGARYVIALAETASGYWHCATTGETGEDADGLSDWDMHRSVLLLNNDFTATNLFLQNSKCMFALYGRAVPTDATHITGLSVRNAPSHGNGFVTGETIEIEATFSTAVTGNLTLPITIGSNTVELTASADNATTVTFSHEVVSTNRDDNGFTFDWDTMSGTVNAALAHPELRQYLAHSVNAVPKIRWYGMFSQPVAPQWYTTGETISVTANFTHSIKVIGDPIMSFSLSSNRTMTYDAALSDHNSMVFSYTVLATDADDNGIWLGPNAITLDSDDAVKDAWSPVGAEADADLTHGRPRGGSVQRDHKVSPLPRLASITITSDPQRGTNSDTYGAGDVIELTTLFNQDVIVTGEPTFRFGVTDTVHAAYSASDSSGPNVVFQYTVLATDVDTDGIFISEEGRGNPSFILDTDDSIQNASGVDAIRNFILRKTFPGHKVDGSIAGGNLNNNPDKIADALTGLRTAPPRIFNDIVLTMPENSTAARNLQATDPDTADADLTWSITGGIDQRHFSLTTAGALAFQTAKDHEEPDDVSANGSYEVTVEVSDGANTDSTILIIILTNVNEAPTANAGQVQGNVVGASTVSLKGSGTDPDEGDTLSYAWTQTSGEMVTLSDEASADPTFTAPDATTTPSNLVFTLTVSDRRGLTNADTVTVNVAAEPEQTPIAFTAAASQIPANHDGNAKFTFELTLSEEPKDDFSYKTMKNHAFTITGGTIDKTNRLNPPSNIGWLVHVTPNGNSAITVTLPATTDCAGQGAICTQDGRMLSQELVITVQGPSN